MNQSGTEHEWHHTYLGVLESKLNVCGKAWHCNLLVNEPEWDTTRLTNWRNIKPTCQSKTEQTLPFTPFSSQAGGPKIYLKKYISFYSLFSVPLYVSWEQTLWKRQGLNFFSRPCGLQRWEAALMSTRLFLPLPGHFDWIWQIMYWVGVAYSTFKLEAICESVVQNPQTAEEIQFSSKGREMVLPQIITASVLLNISQWSCCCHVCILLHIECDTLWENKASNRPTALKRTQRINIQDTLHWNMQLQ